MVKEATDDPIKQYLSDLGTRGGQSKSEKKRKAARLNAQRARAARYKKLHVSKESEEK